MLKKYYSVFGPALRCIDSLILAFSWILAYYLRKFYPLDVMRSALPEFSQYQAYIIFIILLWGTVFTYFDVYSSKRMTRRTIEAYNILRAHFFCLLIFIALTYFVTAYKLSRGVFLYFGSISALCLVFTHVWLRNIVRHLRTKGFNLQRIIIIGTEKAGLQAYRKLTHHPELGLEIIGFIGNSNGQTSIEGKPLLGTIDKISEIIQKHSVQKVVIALSRAQAGLLENILEHLKDDIVDVVLIPDIYDFVSLTCEVEDFDGLPLVSLNETPILGFNLLLKRIFDILVALFALIILSPVMFLLACIIKLTSRGPIFYRQERMSLNGKSFHMLKFRSMSIEQQGDVELLTKKDDPRVTFIGQIMRKTSLDELPQFINVLNGEMSIVGPRPERTWVVEQVRSKIPRYMLKHKVKAGITGWAQVNGWRGDTSLEKRIEYDLFYIKHWSLLFDIKIMVLTFFRGFINRNAY